MKNSVIAMLLLVGSATCAPTFDLFSSSPSQAEERTGGVFNPLDAISSLFGSSSHEERSPSHELISLDEYPVWRLHHYSGLELKPVTTDVAVPPQLAPDTQFVTADKPEAPYGLPEEVSGLDHFDALSAGLTALSTIRESISGLRDSVLALPKMILGAIGLSDEEQEEEETPRGETPEVLEEGTEGLPALPGLQQLIELPASVLAHLPKLPKLPLTLPLLHGKSKKKPAVYLIVNKPEEEEEVTYPPPKEHRTETPAPYGVPKEPITTYEAPKPVPTYQEPPFSLPTSYNVHPNTNFAQIPGSSPPEGLVLPVNVIRNSSPQELHALAVAGSNALNNFNSAGEAIDALNSLNEINSLGSLASERLGGFQPSSFASSRVDAAPVSPPQAAPSKTSQGGHLASSTPTRASPPGFKSSLMDPVIVMPSNTKTKTQ